MKTIGEKDVNRKLKYEKLLSNPKTSLDELQKFVGEYIPQQLYRYKAFDKNGYWKDELLNGKIHLSEPDMFNDPFDSLLRFDFEKLYNDENVNKEITEYIKRESQGENSEKITLTMLKKAEAEAIKNSQKDIAIACFSEANDSILMWSHYSDFHKGICIEYNTSNLGTTERSKLYPVLYNTEKFDSTNDLKNHSAIIKINYITHKAKEWCYEKEWRVAKKVVKDLDGKKNESFIEWGKNISAVYIGVKCEENIEDILEWGNQNKIKIYQMKLSNDEYKLKPKLISKF